MQMAKFDPANLPLTSYKMADSLIRKWTEEEVAIVSLEAATFWTWVRMINLPLGAANRA